MKIKNSNSVALAKMRCFVLLALVGCTSSPISAIPKIVNADAVKACQFISEVEANSGYGKNSNWQLIAHDIAINEANNLSATHLVLVKTQPIGAFNGVLFARAYRCYF